MTKEYNKEYLRISNNSKRKLNAIDEDRPGKLKETMERIGGEYKLDPEEVVNFEEIEVRK